MSFLLFRNFFSLAGAEAFSKVITFLAFAYLARLFGASGFGYIEWAAAALMCASLIVDQGFSAYGTREIAKSPERTGQLVAEIVTARFILAITSYSALAAAVLLIDLEPVMRSLLLIYGASLLILPLLLQWVFQGHDRMNVVALAQVIRQTVFVGVVFLFVKGTEDLYVVGVAEIAGVACAALFTSVLYRIGFAKLAVWKPALSYGLFREGFPIGLSQMFWTAKMFGATFLVGVVADSRETGLFAGAMRIYIALHTFVWLYYANLLPSLSRGWDLKDGSFRRLIFGSMKLVVPGSLGIAVVWVFLSSWAMGTAYGPGFVEGGQALAWLAGAFACAAISGHFRFGLIAAGFQNQEMWTSAAGAIAALVLIPVGYSYAGIGGCAAGLFIGEVLVLLLSGVFGWQLLFGVRPSNR
ncbi:MAG: oligosaccharide flippase family protein [Acidobacteriota bacterium]|nr:MAG: oligosaccharide flippase family protein [Acidobacteriota bacterium]